eukprot:GHVP01059420.1.p1 GENE.GHVP01059420.1~~GHVP01059420.1.p1  ORF type:complete len:440 (+),score=65.89 GHVP01059420.1:32-1351(+)
MTESEERQVQIRFVSDLTGPLAGGIDQEIVVSTNSKRIDLSHILNNMMQPDIRIPFDFLIENQYLRSDIEEFLNQTGHSREKTLEVKYTLCAQPSEVVSSKVSESWILSVCPILESLGHGRIATTSSGEIILIEEEHEQFAVKVAVPMSSTIPPVATTSSVASELDTLDNDPVVVTSVVSTHSNGLVTASTIDMDDNHNVVAVSQFHQGSANSIRSSRDNKFLVTAGDDAKVAVWGNDQIYETIKNSRASVGANRKRKSTSSPVVLKPVTEIVGHTRPVKCAVFDSSSTRIASASLDMTFRLWDCSSGTQISSFACPRSVLTISCSPPAETIFATGHDDGSLRVWDVRTGKSQWEAASTVRFVAPFHQRSVMEVQWSPESEHLFASVSHDKSMIVTDLRSPTLPLARMKASDRLMCCNWTGSNSLLAGGEEGVVRKYNF